MVEFLLSKFNDRQICIVDKIIGEKMNQPQFYESKSHKVS